MINGKQILGKLTLSIVFIALLNVVALAHNSPVKNVNLHRVLEIVSSSDKTLPVERTVSDMLPEKVQAITPEFAEKITREFDFPNLDNQINQHLAANYPDLILSDDDTNMAEEDKLQDVFIKLAEYDASEKIAKARGGLAKAREIGSFIKKLTGEDLVSLPLVHADTISNVIFTLAIQSIRFYPTYSELEVYMGIEIPDKDVVLYFGSPNIKFSSSGGIIGDAVLGLYADCPLPIGGNKAAFLLKKYYRNPAVDMNTTDDPNTHMGTFVRIDCDGFVEMGLDAEIIFSKDWILPINENKVVIAGQRVKARIATIVTNWNNILVTVNLPNFTLTKNQEFAFNLSNAVFDFSDFRNDPNVVFPEAYAEQHLLPDNPNLWRGVYIQNIEVALPHPFKKKGCTETAPPAEQGGGTPGGVGAIELPDQSHLAYWDNGFDEPISGPNVEVDPMIHQRSAEAIEGECRIVFGADHLLIDQMGVSGLFYSHDVLPLNEGAMDKWAFSVDSVKVEVTLNKITAFGFAGKIVIPITKESTALFYDGFFDDGKNYKIAIGIAEDLEFPLWKAGEVNLEAGSKIEVNVVNNKFKPRAILSGTITIGVHSNDEDTSPDGKKVVQAPNIEFKKLILQTTGPYIGIAAATATEAAGYFKLNQDIKVAGFPVSISGLGLVGIGTDECGLEFTMNIDLMNEDNHGFAASGSFTVIGKAHTSAGVQSWKYNRLQFDEAEVFIILPKVAAYGYINIFRGDLEFGDGFQASLIMEIMDGKYVVEANGIFGNTFSILGEENGYRYWYVDGFVGFTPSIPVAGPLAINGFGGGLYHHMKLDGYEPNGGSGLGVTTSGLKYKPSLDISFGLKASVGVEFVNPTAAAGDFSGTVTGVATLELAFGNASNGNAGLQYISLLVSAEMRSGSSDGASNSQVQAKIKARQARLHKNETQTKAADKEEAKVNSSTADEMKASIHIVMDFANGFDLYGMLRVYAVLANGKIRGTGGSNLVGAAHLLIKTSSSPKRWHIYIGGRFNPPTVVEDYNGDNVVLNPVGLMFHESGNNLTITASAEVYLMVGNDLDGPGYPSDQVLDRFKVKIHDLINTDAVKGNMARGTGFLFGAEAHLKVHIGISSGYVKVDAGMGFNIGIIKYGSSAKCAENNQSPVGMKGWRASGNFFFDVRAECKWKVFKKKLNVGVLIWGSLPKPSQIGGKVKFSKWRKGFNAGKQCTVVN